MRRTLTVLVTAAAFLVPAGAASAAEVAEVPAGTNASCNNGKGGNYDRTLSSYNGKGKLAHVELPCVRGGGDDDPTPPFVSN